LVEYKKLIFVRKEAKVEPIAAAAAAAATKHLSY